MAFVNTSSPDLQQLAFLQDFQVSHLDNRLPIPVSHLPNLFMQKTRRSLHELPPQQDPVLEKRRQRAGAAHQRRQDKKRDIERLREEIAQVDLEASRLRLLLAELDQQRETLSQAVNLTGHTHPGPEQFWLS